MLSAVARKVIRKANTATPLYTRAREEGSLLPKVDLGALHDVPWRIWLRRNFPHIATADPSDFHEDFWEWISNLTPGIAPEAYIGCWFRGAGKTTTVELGVSYVGLNLKRRFSLLVSETQAQADEKVKNVGEQFTSLGVRNAKNDLGYSLGWRANMLRVENGFNVLGVGLDKAVRGIKLANFRPDWIIFDDIDGREDTEATTKKKIRTITEKILKAGSADLAATFVQNLVFKGSIMWQVVHGTSDFLMERNAAEVIKAADNLTYESVIQPNGLRKWKVTGGTPRWPGFGLKAIEKDLNRAGLRAFKRESLQDVEDAGDGLWDRERDINPFRITTIPPFEIIGVGVDPSGSSTGDEAGIIAAGVSHYRPRLPSDPPLDPKSVVDTKHPDFIKCGELHGYVLADRSLNGTPAQWSDAAVSLFHLVGAHVLVAETNFGGDMVVSTIGSVKGAPNVEVVHHSHGKDIRAEPVQKVYEKGRVHHVGVYSELEKEMCGWLPGASKSPNRMDALVIVLTRIMLNYSGWTAW